MDSSTNLPEIPAEMEAFLAAWDAKMRAELTERLASCAECIKNEFSERLDALEKQFEMDFLIQETALGELDESTRISRQKTYEILARLAKEQHETKNSTQNVTQEVGSLEKEDRRLNHRLSEIQNQTTLKQIGTPTRAQVHLEMKINKKLRSIFNLPERVWKLEQQVYQLNKQTVKDKADREGTQGIASVASDVNKLWQKTKNMNWRLGKVEAARGGKVRDEK